MAKRHRLGDCFSWHAWAPHRCCSALARISAFSRCRAAGSVTRRGPLLAPGRASRRRLISSLRSAISVFPPLQTKVYRTCGDGTCLERSGRRRRRLGGGRRPVGRGAERPRRPPQPSPQFNGVAVHLWAIAAAARAWGSRPAARAARSLLSRSRASRRKERTISGA